MRYYLGCGILLVLCLAIGCTKSGDTKVVQNPSAKTEASGGGESKHDTWWCDEHGVIEAECSICQPKVGEACRKKGDWCEMHARAKSQCFICDPKLREKFAVLYRDHYPGKEPPEPTDNK